MAAERPGNASRLMSLPTEILHMIFAEIATLCQHPRAPRHRKPCYCRPQPHRARTLAPLRLVNDSFSAYLTPLLFEDLTFEGPRRHTTLESLAASTLAHHVHRLQLTISPSDFPADELARFQAHCRAASHTAHSMAAYFSSMEEYLVPSLRRFANLRTLIVAVDYKGISPELYSANQLISPCLTSLMRCVKEVGLGSLEELRLGMLYHGGYSNFFSASEVGLDAMAKRPRSVSIKLSDGWGNFTLMPVPK